jgi:hypothetical protein
MQPKKEQIGATLSAEAQFVLACIANPALAVSQAKARLLAGEKLDWEAIRQIANWHRVMPMLYRFVSGNADAVPDSFLAALRADYFGNAIRNGGIARETVRIVSGLEAIGIEVLALKGPVLAITAYGDLALRQFLDLDIFIRNHDLPRVADFLAEAGYFPHRYERDRPDGGYFQDSEDEFFAKEDQVRIDTPRQLMPVFIDVHRWLMPSYFPFAPEDDGLWKRAVRTELEDHAVVTLDPMDSMLFLIAHATKHGWPRLQPICDIAALAARAKIDWMELAAQAAKLQCKRMLLLAAMLAADMLGAEVAPAILAAAAADRQIAWLAGKIHSRMFAYAGGRPALFNEWIVPLTAIERVPSRIRYCLSRGFTPTIEDWEFVALPRSFYPLYWAIRPFRLLVQQGPRLFARGSAPQTRTTDMSPLPHP